MYMGMRHPAHVPPPEQPQTSPADEADAIAASGLLRAVVESMGRRNRCVSLMMEYCEVEALDGLRHLLVSERGEHLVRFRQAHEAHRDSRLIMRAAAEGRPLELQKRLQVGKLASGIHKH